MTLLNHIEQSSVKRRLFLTITITVIALIILEIWAVNRLSTYGNQITKLEATKATLALENQLLKNQVAQKASLVKISEESTKLGYIKIKNVQYLQNLNLALNH